MQTLFSIEPLFPDGFTYEADFINEEEEQKLLQQIHKIELHTFQFQGYEAKRRVASFGWDWNFEKRVLKKGKEIPHNFSWLIDRVARTLAIPPSAFAELLVTEYPACSVINWHRDAPPFELIAGLSLQADCVFKLRPHEKKKQTRKALSIPVKRRSLYAMKGEAREAWQHSTAAVEKTRYSLTLRTLRNSQ